MATRSLRCVLAGAVLVFGACAAKTTTTPTSGAASPAATAEKGVINLRAGLNDPSDHTIAVTEMLPEKITVAAGTKVRWTIAGPEPHSVTFMPSGQTPPPPAGAGALFVPTLPTAPIDGTSLANSGLVPRTAVPVKFDAMFSKPGTYAYQCVIHPLMTGSVTVVDANGKADTQSAFDARAASELNQWLTEGHAAKRALMAARPVPQAQGGQTTWRVEMGSTTPHTDILAFAPVPVDARAGDSVVFVNNSQAPHTATFGNGKPVPTDPESPQARQAAPGKSPQVLTADALFNTGLLPPNAPPGAGPPEAVRSYTYTLSTPGTFTYVCVFHVPSGMTGVIKVT